MDETRQWEALKAGDMGAMQRLYDRHISALYGYGMVLCQDSDLVKDCIQDLFLSIWNHRLGLSIPHSGKAYLLVSLRRRIFDRNPRTHLSTVPLEEAGVNDEFFANPEEMWIRTEEEEETQRRLKQALSRLSDRQREIIHMKYFQQLEYEEIARIMELNYQSARNLVNRALIALRKEMTGLILILMLLM